MTTNPNIEWARDLLVALAANGLREVCFAPGSRSTPLVLAAHSVPELRLHRHLDERSAGFFALGLARVTNTAVALICTSGTAVANFLPAVVEARQSQIPLLLLTADRPPELRHSGANQTIDQVEIFGRNALWSFDMPLPQDDAPPVARRNYIALGVRALAIANGRPRGPVQLNCPFRKPLEPASHTDWPRPADATRPAPTITSSPLATPRELIDRLTTAIASHEQGIIICGPNCPGGEFAQAVAALARAAGYPLLADPASGLRFGTHVGAAPIVGGYENFLANGIPPWPGPDLVIRFGAVPTGKWLNHYLDTIKPDGRLHVRENGIWADDRHRTTEFWQTDEPSLCKAVADQLEQRQSSEWPDLWLDAETAVWSRLPEVVAAGFYDGAAVYALLEALPTGTNLFAGNSLPIRHVDHYGRPTRRRIYTFANRGASGIDGNLSTTLGLAIASRRPTVALVGDITFYHDMNALLHARDLPAPLTIVLLNNDGGGIFRRLPIAAFEPPFTELFVTPHGLDFAPAADLYGLNYHLATDADTFQTALAHSLPSKSPSLVELRTDGAHDAARHTAVLAALNR